MTQPIDRSTLPLPSTTPTPVTSSEPAAPAPIRTLDNPLGTDTSIAEIIARIISIFTAISGSVALLMFVYGGVLWLTSRGNSTAIENGRKAMVYAVIGLFIIFGAYALLKLLFTNLGAGALL